MDYQSYWKRGHCHKNKKSFHTSTLYFRYYFVKLRPSRYENQTIRHFQYGKKNIAENIWTDQRRD